MKPKVSQALCFGEYVTPRAVLESHSDESDA